MANEKLGVWTGPKRSSALWLKQFKMQGRCKLLTPTKGGNFGTKLTHLFSFWLDVSFFNMWKKHHSQFWLDVSLFSHVINIVRSSDWLQLTCVWKFYNTAFQRVYLSVYIIKYCPDGSTLKEDKGGSMAKWSVQYQRSNLFLVSWVCFLVVSSSTPQPCVTCSYS